MVETDRDSVAQFREHVARLIGKIKSADGYPLAPLDTDLVATVRGELRDYRDRAARYIDRMREELAAANNALNEILLSIEDGDAHSEDHLKEEIGRLRSIANSSNLAEVRSRVEQSAASLEKHAEQLRREKNAVIAQLKDEIRALHKAAEESKRAAAIDPRTGLCRRDEYEKLIRRSIVADEQFTVIHVWLQNLHPLGASYSQAIMDQALLAISKRLQNVVPPESVISRWRSDVICVTAPNVLAKRVAGEMLNSVGGKYICMEDGVAHTLHLHVVVTCAAVTVRQDADAFILKLDSLTASA